MNKLFPASILAITIFLVSACLRLPNLREASPNQLKSSQTEKGELAPEPSTDNPMSAFQKKINDLLLAKDFAAIESEATSARDNRERFRGGFWKIASLYDATQTLYAEYKGQKISDEMWKNRIELLNKWKSEMPESITARVALAGAYIEYGWFARGSGWANTVSDSDYAFMKERLGTAEAELLEASKLGTHCPHLSAQLLNIGVANGWPRDKFDKLFDQATKAEPNYIPYYLTKSENLKEKWNGEPYDWQKFIDSLPGKLLTLDTDEVDIIYFAIVADKLSDPTGNNWAMISKDRIKKGFADMEKKFTPSNYRLNQFAYLSCLTMDLDSAKNAFELIGDDRNEGVWNEKLFYIMKQLAQKGPQVAVSPKTRPK